MKANNRRKVFGDAVDLLMDDIEEKTAAGGLRMLPIKKIRPFHDYPFHLYEGDRLEDMVASVREHGILNPVIVQEIDGGYEMLSGHNRMNAAKLVGLKEIPAIVKTDLSEEEAYVYVIETNLMQRSFSDLLISEKAAVLKARYEKESCQGRRNDIIEEIARMEGKELPATCGHGDQRLNTRDMIGYLSNEIPAFMRIYAPYLDGLNEDDAIQLRTAELADIFKKSRTESNAIVKKVADGFRKNQTKTQLFKLWKDKTDTKTPATWSTVNRTPILAVVSKKEYDQARKAFEILNRGTASEKEYQ